MTNMQEIGKRLRGLACKNGFLRRLARGVRDPFFFSAIGEKPELRLNSR